MFVTRLTLKGRSSTPPDPEAGKITLYADETGDVRALNDTGHSDSLLPISASGGLTYFVDATNGDDTASGRNWTTAFRTMDAAFDVLASSDTIYVKGKVKEQLSTPAHVFDVTVIGAANRPRHADAAPLGSESGATWTVPDAPSTTTPLLKVRSQGWRLINILFAGPSAAASVQSFRDAGAGEAEFDGSHLEVVGCRFASGKYGLEDSGGCYNVGIYNSDFHDLTDYAIKSTVGAGVGIMYRWQVRGNRFLDCSKWISFPSAGKEWEIIGNSVLKITTPGIDTSGGAGGNVVVGNSFDIAAADFDPVGGFTGDATDVWSNTLLNAIETGIPAN